jgi:hypothetical protein
MKQKLRLLVPAIALLLSLFPLTSAEAAVTAGASCKKSGQVVVVKGAQFKCVKKGNKLTWSKFTVRTPATPKPSPTPTPSPSPDPKPSASPSASPSPSESPKKVVPNEALVVQALFEEIWKSSATSKTKVKIEIEPARKDSDWAKQQADLTNVSLELFAKMGFDIKTDSTIYIGWGFDWLNNYVPRNSWCYNATWSAGGACGEGILFLNLKSTADWIRSGDKEIPFPSKQVQFVATSITIHELAHQAQRDFAEGNGKNVSFYPAWIREGVGELLKVAGYAKYHDISYIEARDIYLYTNTTFQGCGDAKILEMLMSNNHPRSCNYTAGMLAAEYLAATTKDLRSTFLFAGSKLDGLGPNFNNQTGISEETYRLVMKEVFNLDNSVWDPLVEKYYGTWAP